MNNLSAPVDNGVNNFCGETGGYRVSSGSYSRWTGRKCFGVGHRRPPLGTQLGGRDGSWIDGRKACTGHYESGELRTDAEGSKDIHSGQRAVAAPAGAGERDIVLDLDGLTFMDGAAWLAVMAHEHRARDHGHDLRLVNAPSPVRRIFRDTETEHLLADGLGSA